MMVNDIYIGKNKLILFQEDIQPCVTMSVFINSDKILTLVVSFWLPQYIGGMTL